MGYGIGLPHGFLLFRAGMGFLMFSFVDAFRDNQTATVRGLMTSVIDSYGAVIPVFMVFEVGG